MVITSRARLLALAFVALVGLSVSSAATAQTSYELTLDRATERLNAARETAPIPVDEAFGDQISLYDGTVTFSNVDISIPGNNALPVELRRTYSVMDRREMNGSLRATGQFGAMADWNLDLPNLHGTFAESTGWRVREGADGSTTARCSTTAQPPTVSVFPYEEYWDGYSLHVPGAGDQQLLINNAAGVPQPTNGATYPWITKSFWMISCKATTKNGYPGEAFVATSPEGVKYTFDWVVSRETAGLTKPLPTLPTKAGLSRVTVYFLVTRIEDRFGNYVDFTYSGSKLSRIASSDGRSITITAYDGDNVQIVDSDAGRWQYGYFNGRLRTVTRPDASTWEYAYDGVLRIDVESEGNGNFPADPCRAGFPYAAPYTYTVTSPSKARGRFTFDVKQHWRQYVPRMCTYVYAGGPAYLKLPFHSDVFSLTEKQITGAGLSPMTWTYQYAGGFNGGCEDEEYPGHCPTSKFTTVSGPDSTWQTLEFGVAFGHNEGQLLSKETGSGSGPSLQTTRYTYVDDDTVSGHPFADRVGGDPRIIVADRFTAAALRPLSKTTVTAFEDNGLLLDKYVTTVDTFDNFARPRSVTRALQGATSRTDVTAYYDDLSKWVLGQMRSVTNSNTGKVSERIDYYPATALPQNLYAFGLLKETRAYETDGTLKSVKDGLLRETKLTSWYRGIPRTITYADLSSVTVAVNPDGTIGSIKNEKQDTTSYGYDPMGRIKSVTYPADPNNWGVESTTRQFVSGELGVPADTWRVQLSIGQHRIRRYYDALMRPLLTEDKDEGSGLATYARASFDHRGLTTFKSYPSANTIASTGIESLYDVLGRLRQRETSDAIVLETVEYLAGNRRRSVDGRQNATTTQYQAFGEPSYELPTRIEAPEQQLTVIDRDVFGKMTAVTQSGNNFISATRTLSYDAYERLCKRQDPESATTLLGYDAASQLTWEAKGQSATACTTTKPASATQFVYWPRGWTKTVDYADATGDVSYTYEANGNVKTAKNPTATWTYGWNKRGLLESESVTIDSLTFLVDPEYNARGDLKSLGYPGGRTVSLAPDASGRPTQLGTWIGAVKYHPNGVASTFDVGTFGHYETTLNNRQWPELVRQWGGASAAEMSLRYGYDANGNVLSIDDLSPMPNGLDDRTMAYDGLDRLWRTTGPEGNRDYAYDALNNITSAGFTKYLYFDNTNRLSGVDGGGVIRTYAYNARGEVTSDGLFSFTRNNAGQITAIPGVGTYAYDGNGKRIKSVVNGRTEYSIYRKSGELIQFYDKTALARTDLLQLQGKTLVEIKKVGVVDTPTYLSVDLLGSPVVFSNANGQLISRESYGPYGEKLKDVDNVVGYTGHAHDFETGLTYAQARYYDGQVGRFLSSDPRYFEAHDPSSFNRYAYANNNPYKFTDPTGEVAIAGPVLVGGGLLVAGCAATPSCSQAAGEAVKALADAGAEAINRAAEVVGAVVSSVMNEASDGDPAAAPASGDSGRENKTLKPGPNAGESVPARGPDRDFTPGERGKVNEIGNRDGCHTCGSKEPGTKSGNWVPDHQPPSAINSGGESQKLFPQCLTCSRTQGGEVRQQKQPPPSPKPEPQR